MAHAESDPDHGRKGIGGIQRNCPIAILLRPEFQHEDAHIARQSDGIGGVSIVEGFQQRRLIHDQIVRAVNVFNIEGDPPG